MIATSMGTDVIAFLDRVRARTDRFKEVIICSPFVDGQMADRLAMLLVEARPAQCAVRVVTTPEAAEFLSARLPGHPAFWRGNLVARRRLHAKIYLAVARRPRESEAIVTSANLTIDGMSENIELGIRVLATTEFGRRVLQQVHHFVRRVAA
jgi:phosphatidylserine/phosphatidylglycerophosphate/cardiolipin synthase-like enzyme